MKKFFIIGFLIVNVCLLNISSELFAGNKANDIIGYLKGKMYSGYSASGDFSDRFAASHPELVKAVAFGATLDDMILPLRKWQGEKLIFPSGIYDYQKITGRGFELEKHNSFTGLIYIDEDDDNNMFPFTDCYRDRERSIIIKLWGYGTWPRVTKLMILYDQSGGQGRFILDKVIEHGMPFQMEENLLRVFKADRGSNLPVYPIPEDAAQLKYTFY